MNSGLIKNVVVTWENI